MAELLLRKADSPERGFYRGDVIESRRNGFQHTALELANYIIVRVRDQDAGQFVKEGVGRNRSVAFDLDAVEALISTGQGVKILSTAHTASCKRTRSADAPPSQRRVDP